MPLTFISHSATASGLQADGPMRRPLSTPACEASSLPIELEGIGNNSTGLWECTPGSYERQVEAAEVMHILNGRGTFTPEGGSPQAFAAGDTLFFPARTFGVWHLEETVRKVYVIFGG